MPTTTQLRIFTTSLPPAPLAAPAVPAVISSWAWHHALCRDCGRLLTLSDDDLAMAVDVSGPAEVRPICWTCDQPDLLEA